MSADYGESMRDSMKLTKYHRVLKSRFQVQCFELGLSKTGRAKSLMTYYTGDCRLSLKCLHQHLLCVFLSLGSCDVPDVHYLLLSVRYTSLSDYMTMADG